VHARAPDFSLIQISNSLFGAGPSLRASAKQSMPQHKERMDCFVAFAPRNDEKTERKFPIRLSNSRGSQVIGHSTASWFETRGAAALLTMRV
jgi:hypothetical protein